MYGPLLSRDNMLAIDLRGTGCSTVINCPALQNYQGSSSTLAFSAAVGKCGDSLNKRWRAPDGSWIHASDLFTSGPAAAAVDTAGDALARYASVGASPDAGLTGGGTVTAAASGLSAPEGVSFL